MADDAPELSKTMGSSDGVKGAEMPSKPHIIATDALEESRSLTGMSTELPQPKSKFVYLTNINCGFVIQGQNNRVSGISDEDKSVFSYHSETDYVDESDIDDDDRSLDWEGSTEDSHGSSIDEKAFFQRVDTKVNPKSHCSLITLMINEQIGRSNNLNKIGPQPTMTFSCSRTSYKAHPTLAVSLTECDGDPVMMKRSFLPSTLKPTIEMPRTAAQPIITTTGSYSQLQAACSPRTNRRNMLATELTESLRRSLLWERQQTSFTANAVKRRRISHNVVNQKQDPEDVGTDMTRGFSWKDEHNFGHYHLKGW